MLGIIKSKKTAVTVLYNLPKYFCNNFYKDNENILNKTKEIVNNIKNKEEFNNYYNKKTTINDDDFLTYYLFKKTYYIIRNGLYPNNGRKPKYHKFNERTKDINEFFKNVEYKQQEYFIYME